MSSLVVLTVQTLIAPIFHSCYSSTTGRNDAEAQQFVFKSICGATIVWCEFSIFMALNIVSLVKIGTLFKFHKPKF
jgi:hypothetical protein